MERISPITFIGPRAYFTNFDPRTVKIKRNKNIYSKEIERKLKILLLTKSFIICPASHLTTYFTYNFFKHNPILLEKGLIIPALRIDKRDFSDLFFEIKLESYKKNELISFYTDTVPKVVDWELRENTDWFKAALLMELKDDRSVLRRNLINLDKSQINHIIDIIEKGEIITRSFTENLADKLPQKEKKIFKNFIELLYHLSGARIVNCESVLSQENYIDYSLADLESHKIILSDQEIFWKIFLEIAFDQLLNINIPIEHLDIFSFEDIYKIRKPITNSNFMQRYESLIVESIKLLEIDTRGNILINFDDLIKLREDLYNKFFYEINKELNSYYKKKKKAILISFSPLLYSFALGIFKLLPNIAPISLMISKGLKARSILMNLTRIPKIIKAFKNYEEYKEQKKRIVLEKLYKFDIPDRQEFINFVELFLEYSKGKLST